MVIRKMTVILKRFKHEGLRGSFEVGTAVRPERTNSRERVDTARLLTEKVLKEKYPSYQISSSTHVPFSASKLKRIGINAKKSVQGSVFFIHDGYFNYLGRVICLSSGKPVIQVLPEHQKLGNALSDSFKEHAKFFFNPKVKIITDNEMF